MNTPSSITLVTNINTVTPVNSDLVEIRVKRPAVAYKPKTIQNGD